MRVCPTHLHFTSRADMRVVVDTLADPPEGEWVVSVAESGQKHSLPYAVVNRGRARWRVRMDALDVDAPATHRAALLRTRSDTLDKIAKLQGEGDLTEAQVLRSRPWRTLMARIAPILERHPEVAAEMASALEEVEG